MNGESSNGAGGSQALVCPFCRTAFEGEETCPDHELALVPHEQLAEVSAESGLEPEEFMEGLDERLEPFDLRFGRGWVLFGALLMVVSTLLPFVETRTEDSVWNVSALSFSAARGAILWMVPAAGTVLMWLMVTRRNRRELRALRLAVPALVLAAATALGYATWGFFRGAQLLEAQTQAPVTSILQAGFYVMLAGVLAALLGAFRLGGRELSGRH